MLCPTWLFSTNFCLLFSVQRLLQRWTVRCKWDFRKRDMDDCNALAFCIASIHLLRGKDKSHLIRLHGKYGTIEAKKHKAWFKYKIDVSIVCYYYSKRNYWKYLIFKRSLSKIVIKSMLNKLSDNLNK